MYKFAVSTQFLTCRFYSMKCGASLLLLPPTVSSSKGGAPSQYPWNAGPFHGILAVADTFVHCLSRDTSDPSRDYYSSGAWREVLMVTGFLLLLLAPTLLEWPPNPCIENPQSNLGRFSCWFFSVLPWGESGQLYIHWYFPIIYYLDRIAWLIIDHRTVTD